MNALQPLALNVSVQDLMLNHLMLAPIDPETQREWEFITVSRTDIPTTADLVTFLKSRCRSLVLILTTQSLEMFPAAAQSSHTMGSNVSKALRKYVAIQIRCSLCQV